MQQRQSNPIIKTSPLRLKCIVLGSSGAGKTTFLRRYFRGTFDAHRFPTKGADFYSSILPNPQYIKPRIVGEGDVSKDKDSRDTNANATFISKQKHSHSHKKKKSKKKSKRMKHSKEKHNDNVVDDGDGDGVVGVGNDGNVASSSMSDAIGMKNTEEIKNRGLLLGSMDHTTTTTTSGSSSHNQNHKRKKRHKHSKKKDRTSANASASASTDIDRNLGQGQKDIHIDSNNDTYLEAHEYEYEYDNTMDYNYNIHKRLTIALQMWDTAGKERLVSQSTQQLTSRLGDAFFRHANVAILMYDATSSRSFLQLIKWYSELLERVHRLQVMEMECERERECEKDERVNGNVNGIGNASSRTTRTGYGSTTTTTARGKSRINYHPLQSQSQMQFPVLVVASKLDVVMAKEASRLAQKKEVPQRRVMGLESFRGMNYHYEYGDANDGRIKYGSSHGHGHGHGQSPFVSTSVRGNGHGQDKRDNSLRSAGAATATAAATYDDRMSPLSYGHSWAHDKSYLQCIRIAEDACYPDREMVLRWCRRNGLQHVEVSALENIGVDVAVRSAVNLALDQMKEEEKIEMKRKRERERDLEYAANMMNHHHRHSGDQSSSLKNNSLRYQQRHLQNDECTFCPWLLRIIRKIPMLR